jgi:hypothetical protein
MSLRAIAGTTRDTKAGGFEVASMCKALIAGGGDPDAAHAIATKWPVTPRVLGALAMKASMPTTSGPRDDSDLTDVSSAFLQSLGHYGCFDRLLPDMMRVPLPARYGVVTTAATASIVNAGMMKPLTALQVTSDTMPATKTVAMVVMSREASRLSGPPGGLMTAIVQRELSQAVAATTDLQFLTTLIAGATPVNATGIDARAVRRDLQAALALMTTSSASRLYVLVNSGTAKKLATAFSSSGDAAFPEMSPQAPDSPASASTMWRSLWQENLVAVVCERFWGVAVLGSTAVQLIQNSAYGDSPAP